MTSEFIKSFRSGEAAEPEVLEGDGTSQPLRCTHRSPLLPIPHALGEEQNSFSPHRVIPATEILKK